jgi:hypothetical protein
MAGVALMAAADDLQDSTPAARLGRLVMSVGDPSSPLDPGDPAVLLRIEAHIRESGHLELQ